MRLALAVVALVHPCSRARPRPLLPASSAFGSRPHRPAVSPPSRLDVPRLPCPPPLCCSPSFEHPVVFSRDIFLFSSDSAVPVPRFSLSLGDPLPLLPLSRGCSGKAFSPTRSDLAAGRGAMATPMLLTPSRMRAHLASGILPSPPRGGVTDGCVPSRCTATPPPTLSGATSEPRTPPSTRGLFPVAFPDLLSSVSPACSSSSSLSTPAAAPASSFPRPCVPAPALKSAPAPSSAVPALCSASSTQASAVAPATPPATLATEIVAPPPEAAASNTLWTVKPVVVPPPARAPPPPPPSVPSTTRSATPSRRNRPAQRARPALRVLGESPLVAPTAPPVTSTLVPVAAPPTTPIVVASAPRAARSAANASRVARSQSRVVASGGRAARAPATNVSASAAVVPPKVVSKPVGPKALGPKAPPAKGVPKVGSKARAPPSVPVKPTAGQPRPVASVSHGAVAVAFAGCTFESASPAPSALPLPSFGGSGGKVTERFALRRHVPCG